MRQTDYSALADFEDEFSGERVFIIGNGPSLKETPLEELNSEYSIAMNKITKIFRETNWRPSFYFHSNSPDISASTEFNTDGNYLEEVIGLDIPCFINSGYESKIPNYDNVFYFDKFSLFGNNPFDRANLEEVKNMPRKQLEKFWSDNISYHIYHYHTLYGACQLAVYLGFDEIYFLGCDLGLEYKNPHMVFESGLDPYRFDGGYVSYFKSAMAKKLLFRSLCNGAAMKLIESKVLDVVLNRFITNEYNDHFSPDYFTDLKINDGEEHEKEVIKSHRVIKEMCDLHGISVFNATLGGELDVYDRIDLDKIL